MNRKQLKLSIFFILLSSTAIHNTVNAATLLSRTASYAKGAACGLTPLAGHKMMRWISKGQDIETQKSLFRGYKHSSISAITASSLVTAASAGLAALFLYARHENKKALKRCLNAAPSVVYQNGKTRKNLFHVTPELWMIPMRNIIIFSKYSKLSLGCAIASGVYAAQKLIEYKRVSKDFASVLK